MKAQGICPLCGTYGDIVDSHIELPRFVYKRLFTDNAPNPRPVYITQRDVRQSQDQNSSLLLCFDCDSNRFGKLGERWVANACLQKDMSFPLRDAVLKFSDTQVIDSTAAIHRTATAPFINHAALQYFAASMVWRAKYNPDPSAHIIELGPFESQFREYLLGLTPFPAEASLNVFIRYRSNLTQLSHGIGRGPGCVGRRYRFSIPGLTFIVTCSDTWGIAERIYCFVHAPGRIVLDADAVELSHDMAMKALYQASGKKLT